MSKTYRWTIVGLGNIAHSFVKYFDQPDGEIYAVCSRSQEKAKNVFRIFSRVFAGRLS
ncbi:Gfo/Idh/MocA family oxidoreductase [Lactiplantibacillus plantarum]|uniref:hypothetical protein n=1 Tax=Lactiplantibacillus plantarum TaxID=1590 RepID=UPI0021CB042E|nr:Gfo/Idh/MocA family oxidoreductase [Lactiplantibacillus plantarum]MCG0866146.1 Gfo/Idh/MocA family oxidoreductase [Lactiplantibacillus plantarum]